MTTQQAKKHFTLEATPHTVFIVTDPMGAFRNQGGRRSHRDEEPTAQTLPMFVQLSTPIPADLKLEEFFDREIQVAQKRDHDLHCFVDSIPITARLLNFDGVPLGVWKNLKEASTLWDAELACGIQWMNHDAWVAATTTAQASARFLAMVDEIELQSAEWADSGIDVNRCSANVWIERDRKVLTLTNEFFGLDVFTLTDEAVDEAIDSGHLTPPRHPRPNEEAWLPCLVNYAESVGLSLCGIYPQESAETQEAETPRG